MLSLLGFLTICVFLGFILTRRLSVLLSLILVPVVFALIAGFGPKEVGEMLLGGIKQVAPTGILLIFAVLYFSVMIDTGLFDPVIAFIIRFAKGDPLKITLGTAVLTMLVHLDGDGTDTLIITVTALCVVLKFIEDIARLTALAKHRQLADVCFIMVQLKRFAKNTEKPAGCSFRTSNL